MGERARTHDGRRVLPRRRRVHNGLALRHQHEPVVLGEVEEVIRVEGLAPLRDEVVR